jgi:hypothetical protein
MRLLRYSSAPATRVEAREPAQPLYGLAHDGPTMAGRRMSVGVSLDLAVSRCSQTHFEKQYLRA